MTSSGYLSHPHVHGDAIAFVVEDDVWLAPSDGGRAWRLSASQGLARGPRLSRDGSQVAWTESRYGEAEVYLADVGGGVSKRLTYWGDDRTTVRGWSPEGKILAVSAVGQPFNHFTWAYAISADGGAPGDVRLPYGLAADLAVEPDAVALLEGSASKDLAHWKRYRGGAAGRLWIRTGSESFRRVLAELGGQFNCPMLVSGRLAFLSDHEGIGNLYSCALDGSDLRRHTDHDASYARQAATDGSQIVYSCAGQLWLLDDLEADQPRPLDITTGSVPARRAPRLISADEHIGNLSCDATGRASAVEVRGTVHWLTHRDGPAVALAVSPAARARLPQVLGPDGDVVWVTDADGADALELGNPGADSAVSPRRIAAAGSVGSVASLAAAPDGSKVAIAATDGYLRVLDVASGALSELVEPFNGPITGLAWSTDSAWLAWSQPGLYPLRRLRIARISDRQISDVTDGRFVDTDPVFTIDGLYLAFLSKRSFDPVMDAHFFDLSFPYGARPYLVPLAASTGSPFGPRAGGWGCGDDEDDEATPEKTGSQAAATGTAGPDKAGPDKAGSGKDGAESAGPDNADPAQAGTAKEPVAVDTAGIAERVVALPVPESRYSSLRAVKGGLAWLCVPTAGALGEGGARPEEELPDPALQRFDLRQHTITELDDEVVWYEVSGDGRRLVVCDDDGVAVLPADRKADADNPRDRIAVDGSRARFLADPAAMWRHAFGELDRLVRREFWRTDFNGVDWDGVLDLYRPLLDLVSTPEEFADLAREVLGELGSSHAYVAAAPTSGYDGSGFIAGILGADLERAADGSWLVGRVVPGESSDPRARSPLAAPGVGVRAGDRLVAVDGRPVGADGPGPLLAGSCGKPVELTVASGGPAGGGAAGCGPVGDGAASDGTAGGGAGGTRKVVVVPLLSERRLRYQDWVASRRALVRRLSGGRMGYLHVPDMEGEGWADFHRDLRAEMMLDALIVDARGNKGGEISALIVEKLARRVIAWDVIRNKQPVPYPLEAPLGPIVTVSDEFAGSDGDIVTQAIKTLALGPVVGTRTWGGVVGIEDWYGLVDGTRITVPQLGFWMEGPGFGMENYGVDPDVEVLITPEDWTAGRDTQLEAAVQLATTTLRNKPPARPPSADNVPSRRRPVLPPRSPRS